MDSAVSLDRIIKNYQHVVSIVKSYSSNNITPKIVIVTKNQPLERISELAEYIDSPIFGENRFEEAIGKIDELQNQDIEWHFIGHLQRNKVKKLVGKVAMIQSLDRLPLALEIQKRASNKELIVDCLLQIDISRDGTKFGLVPDEKQIIIFLKEIEKLKNLRICGLMTIAPFIEAKRTQSYFRQMRSIFDKLKDLPLPINVELKTLSMGMSNDYQFALKEGSNMVRLGTVIFQK